MFQRMSHWDEKSIAKWEHTRSRGMKRFIWRKGILGWGGFMFLTMTPFNLFLRFGTHWPSPADFPIRFLLFSGILWMVAGCLFGFTTWALIERAYRKHRLGVDGNPAAS
ncbi:MAG: hypothetical protein FJ189_02480 [Gammaproteobacteria bacterium]|nr:hypothetical protein [Gammaproteobacteria bacterium]